MFYMLFDRSAKRMSYRSSIKKLYFAYIILYLFLLFLRINIYNLPKVQF